MRDEDNRPDPDKLLRLVTEQERRQARGRLRVFLGACPGVGKTYAMLDAARLKKSEGLDLCIGLVETHGREETEALLYGMEVLPRREIEYKGRSLREFDLDGAIARRPALILVDELAHENAPGCRHAKRWQDVEELLDAGIDVYTTLNVQHIESLNDVVAQITGVRIRETVPDAVLERSEAVVLVDLPPEDLQKRLAEGKVYLPAQAAWAAANFFREGNLIALRELALRTTAQRVNTEVLVYRQGRSIETTWPTTDRIMVCVGPSPSSAKLIRAAKRLATGLGAAWLAVAIESPRDASITGAQHDSIIRNLELAKELGATTYMLSGVKVAKAIVDFAREQNVTKIIIGKPLRGKRLRDYFIPSPVDEIIRLSGEIDVHVIRGELGEPRKAAGKPPDAEMAAARELALGLAVTGVSTAVCFAMYPFFDLANLIMVYLLGVMAVAVRLGRVAAITSSAAGVLCFDFFFVPPRFSFAVADVSHVLTFAVMFTASMLLSGMADRIRRHAETSRGIVKQTEAISALSRELATTRGMDNLLMAAMRHLASVFDSHVCFLIPDEHGSMKIKLASADAFSLDGKDMGVAQWVYANAKPAGLGTQTLPDTSSLFLPLAGASGVLGVAGIRPLDDSSAKRLKHPDRERLLDSFVSQTALALEVDRLEDEANLSRVEMETEKLRSSLLSAVTHDFQTPLAAIAGSAESLLALGEAAGPEVVAAMSENIHGEALRLSRLVANLLRIVKLESGDFKPNLALAPVQEVLGAALTRLEKQLAGRTVDVSLPDDLPDVPMDAILMEQLFVNLFDNAAKHTPAQTPIAASASLRGRTVEICVSDQGPGLPPADVDRVFERFYRVPRQGQPEGYGLGLAICRAIAKVHGGVIRAENRPEGGVAFCLTLPLSREFRHD